MSLVSGSSLGTSSNRQWPQSRTAGPYVLTATFNGLHGEPDTPMQTLTSSTHTRPAGSARPPQDKAWRPSPPMWRRKEGAWGCGPICSHPGRTAASREVLPGFRQSKSISCHGPPLLRNLCPSYLSCPSLAVSKPQGCNSFRESQEHSCESLPAGGGPALPPGSRCKGTAGRVAGRHLAA